MSCDSVLAALIVAPARIVELDPDEIPALLAELETIRARLWRRLLVPIGAESQLVGRPESQDRLLTASEAAVRLGVTVRWLYRRRLPFARRLSRKALRFSEAGLDRWVAQQGRR